MLRTKIIIITVLAFVGFAAAFTGTILFGPGPEQAEKPDAAPVESAGGGDLAELTQAAMTPSEALVEQLARQLRREIDDCRTRSRRLDERQERIELAEAHLARQAQALEDLQVGLVAPLASLREEQEKLQQTRIKIEQGEQENLKQMAAMYEKMDPASGGRILAGMCQGGQEDDVAKLLYLMSDRSAAKLLGQITDEKLAADLCRRIKTIQEAG